MELFGSDNVTGLNQNNICYNQITYTCDMYSLPKFVTWFSIEIIPTWLATWKYVAAISSRVEPGRVEPFPSDG
jgi:hypothetical protein